MIRTLAAILLIAGIVIADETPSDGGAFGLPDELEAIIEDVVPRLMAEHGAPGTVVIVVDRSDDTTVVPQ